MGIDLFGFTGRALRDRRRVFWFTGLDREGEQLLFASKTTGCPFQTQPDSHTHRDLHSDPYAHIDPDCYPDRDAGSDRYSHNAAHCHSTAHAAV